MEVIVPPGPTFCEIRISTIVCLDADNVHHFLCRWRGMSSRSHQGRRFERQRLELVLRSHPHHLRGGLLRRPRPLLELLVSELVCRWLQRSRRRRRGLRVLVRGSRHPWARRGFASLLILCKRISVLIIELGLTSVDVFYRRESVCHGGW